MTRMYVGNLSVEVTGADLRALFAAHGQVSSARVVTDATDGQSRGFGFVEMPGQAQALNAIRALDGKSLKGRTLKVNPARPREHGGGRGSASGGWAVVGEGRHRW